jgi:hypothetical protein
MSRLDEIILFLMKFYFSDELALRDSIFQSL